MDSFGSWDQNNMDQTYFLASLKRAFNLAYNSKCLCTSSILIRGILWATSHDFNVTCKLTHSQKCILIPTVKPQPHRLWGMHNDADYSSGHADSRAHLLLGQQSTEGFQPHKILQFIWSHHHIEMSLLASHYTDMHYNMRPAQLKVS